MARLTGKAGACLAVCLLATAALAGAADPRPAPQTDAAWAAAYADIAAQLCGDLVVDAIAERDAGGLYWPDFAAWHEGGAALLAFRAGGRAAEAAHWNAGFCADPAAFALGHDGFVRRFLTRKPTRS